MTARELLRATAAYLGRLTDAENARDPNRARATALRTLADRLDRLVDDDELVNACYAADACADNVDGILRVVLARLDAPLSKSML